jgi:hypothetical protein
LGQPPGEFFVGLEHLQTLSVQGFQQFVGGGLEFGQFGVFRRAEAAMVPLVNQLEAARVQLAPGLGLIGEFGGMAQDLDHPFLKGKPTRLRLPLETLDQFVLQINR